MIGDESQPAVHLDGGLYWQDWRFKDKRWEVVWLDSAFWSGNSDIQWDIRCLRREADGCSLRKHVW
jgi:hypothetical protein